MEIQGRLFAEKEASLKRKLKNDCYKELLCIVTIWGVLVMFGGKKERKCTNSLCIYTYTSFF